MCNSLKCWFKAHSSTLGECMASIINIYYGIKEPKCGYRHCNARVSNIDIW